ncbi:hypothetical protein RJ640_022289 [Escallonia rubra]|uniref:DC1 domain-containing protein n=1 Tax=Escallonia rubra TaxID=112253 RepID=A0AA88RER8_9ASTE|nr:hypothetical protein RJ640_022289 [Escallonia rubra]
MKQLNHFSHRHPLRLSGVQPEDQTICSGCDLDLVGPAYICTKAGCSFLLHESCFELPRRVRHKSHPKHPLVLLSSPPYSDGEFTCNACGESGHAFTFHCLTCKFDLHVECASLPETEDSDDHEHPVKLLYSFPEEEWKDTNFGSSYPPRVESLHTNPIQINYPIRSDSVPNFIPPIGVNPSTVPAQTHQPAHFSKPPNVDSHYTPQSEGIHSNAGPHNYSVKSDSVPSFSLPVGVNTNAAPAQTHQPVHFSKPPNFGPNHTPQPETLHDIPTPNYSMQSDSIPNFTAPMGGEAPAPPAQTYQPAPPNHFSHHHPLHLLKLQEGDSKVCSGCEEDIVGSAYSCTESQCSHFLHKSCFELSRKIQHESHPEHPLVLLSSPPYKEEGEFTCNACYRIGKAFAYHCSTCKYDLHVNCAPLPKTVQREDHEHPLTLLYSSPLKKTEKGDEDLSFSCDVCHTSINEICWLYYCEKCDYGTHSDCVNAAETDPVLAAQLHMQRLQFQLEMSRQNAQFIISMGQSLANLAG